jgi:RNA polymerase sigma-70 factor (ECF subfamily)
VSRDLSAPADLDRVFDEHHRPLHGFLVRMTGRAELAEELLQETFVRWVRHRGRLPPDVNLRAWLFTVARNLYRSHRRWAWVDGQRLAELAARAVGIDAGPTPAEIQAATETARTVERALAAMPESLREVAVLVWIQHLEPREVAPILQLEPEAVRQRLARARRFVDDALSGGEP